MNYNPSTSDLGAFSVAAQSEAVRTTFIRRTYAHLAGAIAVFALLCTAILQSSLAETITATLLGSSMGWLIVLGAFMLVAWVANSWALNATSMGKQYAGLGLYVVAEAIIFTPILYIADNYYPGVIAQAGFLTVILFLSLTMIAFTTRKDFSFLGGVLKIGFLIAIGVIVCSLLFGFHLGTFFSAVMIAMAAGSILYNTSQIQYHYRTNQYVAASLSLFASVALLFWYVMQLLMSLSRGD
jgi:FtsH-binding integral membrane protein